MKKQIKAYVCETIQQEDGRWLARYRLLSDVEDDWTYISEPVAFVDEMEAWESFQYNPARMQLKKEKVLIGFLHCLVIAALRGDLKVDACEILDAARNYLKKEAPREEENCGGEECPTPVYAKEFLFIVQMQALPESVRKKVLTTNPNPDIETEDWRLEIGRLEQKYWPPSTSK